MRLDILRSRTPVPYRKALEHQRELHARRVADEIPDTLWLLEHPPVITTGIRQNQEVNILINPAAVGAEIVETERGGEVTYHGPGQLVGYLFVAMANHGNRVKGFVAALEEAFIDFLKETYEIAAQHHPKHTGVWVGSDKIAAIGFALRKRVTLHGFAFNVNTNLSHFGWIVPCGIKASDGSVTSLEKLLGFSCNLNEIAQGVGEAIRHSLGYDAHPYRMTDYNV